MTRADNRTTDVTAPSVAICIATFQRPAGLRALLASLDALVFDRFQPAVSLIIVDNDADTPVTDTLGPLDVLSRWPVHYLVESKRGIVAARNCALEAVPAQATFVAFLDDDERVSPGWLEAMLAIQAATGAAAVQGPVTPVYAQPAQPWMEYGGYYRLGPFEDGAEMTFAATNNSIVCKAEIDRLGLRFDPRFNHTGGSDQDFFDRLRAGGGRVVASASAEVFDDIPAGRMNLAWVLRRQYRAGNTLGRIEIDRRRDRPARVVKGLGFIAIGLMEAAAGLVAGRPLRYHGFARMARGAGMLGAFFGVAFEEYSNAAVARDRAS